LDSIPEEETINVDEKEDLKVDFDLEQPVLAVQQHPDHQQQLEDEVILSKKPKQNRRILSRIMNKFTVKSAFTPKTTEYLLGES
jgi:hypothetical protein